MNLSFHGEEAAVSLSPSTDSASRVKSKFQYLFLLFLLPLHCLTPEFASSGTINYFYDANGRLIRAEYGNGGNISYTLDAAGNILAVNSVNPASHTDSDGVVDGLEMGPQGNDPTFDGDGNGIPDYQETRAASLPTAVGGQYATLSVPAGLALANVRAVANPSPGTLPEYLEFPYGFFEFTVTGLPNGGCTVATIYLPEDPSLKAYYKYSGTPENSTPHWYPFVDDGVTGAAITHQSGKTVIALSICDDRRGDGDLHLNGTISDPGGPVRIENYFLFLPAVLRQ